MQGKAVLVTGGTAGIGLATALAFGQRGAECTLTYRWGSADEDEVRAAFAAVGAPPPCLVQADVVSADDTAALLEQLRARHERLDVFVSNVAFGQVAGSLADLSHRAFVKTMDYTAWPIVDYTTRIRETFGCYPRYIVGLSSGGSEHYFPGYDLIAAAKAVLETLCRYLSYRLAGEDVRVNVVRAYAVLTDSFHATFGPEFDTIAAKYDMLRLCVSPEEVASTIVALCSGLMDAVTGQVITVDRGAIFADNFMRLYADLRDRPNLG
jgi:NAD(P)-dependent dehydrogenase (short-subunit alcohol dehydrogenase family)